MKKKHQHGGHRTGAGRPAIYEDRGKISVVMEQSLVDALDNHAQAKQTSRSQVVAEALRKMLRIREEAR